VIGCLRNFLFSYKRLDSLFEYFATNDKEVKTFNFVFEKGIECWWRYGSVKLSKKWFNAIWNKKLTNKCENLYLLRGMTG